jgi:transcriptional regulator with XRE-family HTH domain
MSDSIWKKLERSKKYREAFVGSQVKRTVPFQVRALRKQRNWSQAELAERAGVTQGVISRAEDPDYGNLTFNSVVRLAAGFDCAFIGRFVPFSELVGWYDSLSEAMIRVAGFNEDYRPGQRQTPVGNIERWQRHLTAVQVTRVPVVATTHPRLPDQPKLPLPPNLRLVYPGVAASGSRGCDPLERTVEAGTRPTSSVPNMEQSGALGNILCNAGA